MVLFHLHDIIIYRICTMAEERPPVCDTDLDLLAISFKPVAFVKIQTSVTAIHAQLGTVSCHPITVHEARPMVHRANMTSELAHMIRRSGWSQFSSERYSSDSRIPKFNTIPITTIWRHAMYIPVIEPLNLPGSPCPACSGNVGGMKLPSVELEVDGEPMFLKRRVLPYGQREDVLKALQKIEQEGVMSKVESSA
ncbi:unnamed protein product [Echinostoma caproni]|uniref:NTP_transf_2 domain-containing protein n=1 Tax=Echinostoma caproni TaxID=27848 RepID=A0A183B670_9TREM|nr:unnamed protein product [Echinostoma caproni]